MRMALQLSMLASVYTRSDFRKEIQAESEALHSGTTIIETPGPITTRGKNLYRNGIRGRQSGSSKRTLKLGFTDFELSDLKVQVGLKILNVTMKLSPTYHLMCDPIRCVQFSKGTTAERKDPSKAYPW